MAASPGLRELAGRLVRRLNQMVRRGEISERKLAQLTGYSQPHVHNVLSGGRAIPLAFVDRVLEQLELPLLSLFTQEELAGRAPPRAEAALPVPVLLGALGGGRAFPALPAHPAVRHFPVAQVAALVAPQIAWVDSGEQSMEPWIFPGDWLLLDRSPRLRSAPDFQHVYALCWQGMGLLARCRVVGDALVLVVDNPRAAPDAPSHLPLERETLLEIVRARVVWLAREM